MKSRFVFLTLLTLCTSAFAQQVPVAVDPYREWAKQHWGASAVNDRSREATVWGQDADPDGDGYTNLQEYAFGTNPTTYSADPVTWEMPSPMPGYTALTFTQRADDDALLVFPQYSDDLDLWLPFVPRDSFSYNGSDTMFFKYAEGAAANGFKTVTYLCALPTASADGQTPSVFTRLNVLRSDSQAIGSPFDTLNFFDSISGMEGATVDSNSTVLTGFVGSARVSVTGGARLIVNGVDVGTSGLVPAGSTVRLRAKSAATGHRSKHALSIGNLTKTWTVETKLIAAAAGVSGTPSGYSPVSASVGQDGAANASIPITVSPGTGGMEPKLAISYSSQGGNGLLGVGFGLSGLSAVNRTGPTQYLDGFKGGVTFGPNDRFTVDGQRLILYSGTWGGDGSEYRTENESFSKITFHVLNSSGASYWEMKTKAGLTYDYGTSDDSRILANRSSVPGDTAILSWALTAVTDNVGSRYRCIYATPTDADGGYPRVTSIVYTENSAHNLSAGQEVDFTYQARKDVRTSYVAGARVVLGQLLMAIDCKQGGHVARHYDFAYQQAEISNNSQLTSVTEKGKQPTDGKAWLAFQPTRFIWDKKTGDHTNLITDAQATAFDQFHLSLSPPSTVVKGDFKGDGHMGVVRFDDHYNDVWIACGKSDGTFSYNDFYTIPTPGFTTADTIDPGTASLSTGDFNGDGKTDILYLSTHGSNNWVALSNGDGSFDIKRGSQLGALANVAQTADYHTQVIALDLNGDGRTDVVLLSNVGNNRVFLCTGDGSFVEKPLAANDPFHGFLISPDHDATNAYVVPGDFNGDGLGDLLILYADGSSNVMALSNGDGTFRLLSGSQLGSIAATPYRRTRAGFVSGDFNGDGLTDIAHIDNSDGDSNPAWIALSKGNGSFDVMVQPAALQGVPLNLPVSDLLTGDFNGDGFTDVYNASYYPEKSSMWMAYSLGDTTFQEIPYADLGALTTMVYDPGSKHTARSFAFTGDFDGDGTDDIFDLCDRGFNTFLARSNGYNADRVVQVNNGHGGYTRFDYKPLTDSSVYSKGPDADYPLCDITAAMYVVASTVTRNGADGDPLNVEATPAADLSTTNYHYHRAWSVLDGRGYRGFAQVDSTDATTGITSHTYYVVPAFNRPAAADGSHPLSEADNGAIEMAGRPAHQVQSLSDGTVISETINTWTCQRLLLPSKHVSYFPRLMQSVTKDYEINNGKGAAPIKTTTVSGQSYDDFGNLTHSLTDYGNGFTEETTSNYTNDTGHWWLGRLTDTTVIQTSPGPLTATRHSTFHYSPTNGQLSRENIVTPESGLKLEKDYFHDAYGNIRQSILKDLGTQATRTTTTTYTPDGRFINQTTNALGQVETKTYDPLDGTVLSQTGPNGLKTTWSYDGFGRPILETRPDHTQTVTSYLRCTPGNGVPPRAVHCVKTQSSGAGPSTVYFDILDRQIRQDATGFDGGTVSMHQVFDTKGEIIQTSLPFFSSSSQPTAPAGQYTLNVYDPIGRVTEQNVPGPTADDGKPRITTTTYAGLSATVTNPKGETFETTVDVRGRTTSSTSFGTDTVSNTHDPYGNLTLVRDGHGHSTTIKYDARGNKISMSEPNSGTTTYSYNAFGELTGQTDALGRVTALSYDALGRMTRRLEQDTPGGASIETDWVFEKLANGDPNPNGVGKLSYMKRLSDSYLESYAYDTLGRLASSHTEVASMKFGLSTTYDEYSRPLTLVYPSGFAVRNHYNPSGHLSMVIDAATSSLVYWTAESVNARGQVVQEKFGNGLVTHRSYDANTGLIQSIRTGTTSASPDRQNLSYGFDSLNNLTERRDLGRGVTENFKYDPTNQLSNITCSAADPVTITCNHLGNIQSRSDVGTYNYGQNGAGPHAVTSIAGADGKVTRTLTYDAVGNCTWDGATHLIYNAANQPTSILGTDGSFAFSYTPSRARLTRTELVNGTTTNRVYVGSLYERDDNGATVAKIHFIPAGGGVVAIHTETLAKNTPTVTTTRYVHKDHLGSVQTLTDESGHVAEVLSYDAWGRRRTLIQDPTTQTLRYSYTDEDGKPVTSANTDRGFTGHEMLDAVGLIHMNGRIYDPTIGRFLSVDPVVQEAGNLQNLNRYCYVLNNPLSLTDPSGFSFWKKLWHSALIGPIAFTGWGNKHFGEILQTEIVIGGTILGGVPGAFLAGFGSAFTGTLLAGGSIGDAFRAGAISGVTSAASAEAFGYLDKVGGFGAEDFANYAEEGSVKYGEKLAEMTVAHGVVGGLQSVATGGKFVHGFEAGAISAAGSPLIDTAVGGDKTLGTIASGVLGGTASEIGGGKFANGAITGAFGYAYNFRGSDATLKISDPVQMVPSSMPGSLSCPPSEDAMEAEFDNETENSPQHMTWEHAWLVDEAWYHDFNIVYKQITPGGQWGAECAYDRLSGELVPSGQPGAGTANYFPDWSHGHTYWDPGGPRANQNEYNAYWASHPHPPGIQ